LIGYCVSVITYVIPEWAGGDEERVRRISDEEKEGQVFLFKLSGLRKKEA
jgi:hypothetical protein